MHKIWPVDSRGKLLKLLPPEDFKDKMLQWAKSFVGWGSTSHPTGGALPPPHCGWWVLPQTPYNVTATSCNFFTCDWLMPQFFGICTAVLQSLTYATLIILVNNNNIIIINNHHYHNHNNIHDSLPAFDRTGWLFVSIFVLSVIFIIPSGSYLPRVKKWEKNNNNYKPGF